MLEGKMRDLLFTTFCPVHGTLARAQCVGCRAMDTLDSVVVAQAPCDCLLYSFLSPTSPDTCLSSCGSEEAPEESQCHALSVSSHLLSL